MNCTIEKHKNKKQSHYKFCSFISSIQYKEFDLKPDHLAILFIICRYLDMPKNICCSKQVNLSHECKMSETSFRRHTQYLEKQNLLIRNKKGKLYWYELGSFFDDF